MVLYLARSPQILKNSHESLIPDDDTRSANSCLPTGSFQSSLSSSLSPRRITEKEPWATMPLTIAPRVLQSCLVHSGSSLVMSLLTGTSMPLEKSGEQCEGWTSHDSLLTTSWVPGPIIQWAVQLQKNHPRFYCRASLLWVHCIHTEL